MENNKAAEATSNSAGGATTGQTVNGNGGANPDPSTIPNPKLGMAPLSSELAVAAASNSVPAEIQPPPNPPPTDPLQSTGLQNTRTSIPPTPDPLRPDSTAADLTQATTIPMPSDPEQVPKVNNPPPSLFDSTTPPQDHAPMVHPPEQPHPPNPKAPTPSDPPTADPPADIRSHPHVTDIASEEVG